MIKEKIFILALLLVSLAVNAQAPNWVETSKGESTFIDTNSIRINSEQKNWVNFDMVLNLPLPKTNKDHKQLVAHFGADPIAFFTNATINCLNQTIRKNSDGIAYGAFKSMRKNTKGMPYSHFKESDLLEFKKITSGEFEKLSSIGNKDDKTVQLVCNDLTHSKQPSVDALESNATLSQIFPKLKAKPDLIKLTEGEDIFYLDKNSLETEDKQKKMIKFTLVFDLPNDNQKQDKETASYFLSNSINCTDKTIKINYKGLATGYSKDAWLLEYQKQRKSEFVPLEDYKELIQFVCGS